MIKSKKIFLRILPILMVVVLMSSSVLGINAEIPTTTNNKLGGVTDLAGSIWNTVAIVLQIAAIAAIVVAGVRYMFASANEKANIKTQTITLVVGAILVFAAVPIAKFIGGVANNAL
jgi:succinate dehydrogenase/fumarate reductase cytochrome b subunit